MPQEFQILSQRVFFFEEGKLNLGVCLVMTNWDFKIHCKLRQSTFWVRILDLRNAFSGATTSNALWQKIHRRRKLDGTFVEDVKMVNISGTIEQKNHEMQNRKLSFWFYLELTLKNVANRMRSHSTFLFAFSISSIVQ